MKTPEEKAKELVKKYWMKNKNGQNSFNIAIENALICVDEMLQELKELHHKTPLIYWQEVKQKINEL